MPEIKQAAFSGGEIAPEMFARSDLDRYYTSLKTCRNFIVNSRGAAVVRQGTELVREVKDSTALPRLIPFVFSEVQAYVLEFGHDGTVGYVRFHRDGGTILEPGGEHDGGAAAAVLSDSTKMWVVDAMVGKVITNTTNSETATITANSLNTITGVLSGAETWDPADGYTIADCPLEIPAPWAAADLRRLKYAQRNDVVTICHQSYQPRQLKRLADDNWTLGTLEVIRRVNPPTAVGVSGFKAFDETHPIVSWSWVVTSIDADGSESLISVKLTDASATLYPDFPRPTLTWTPPAAGNVPKSYNVYRGRDGYWGFVGSSDTNAFIDEGYVPNYFDAPPTAHEPFEHEITAGDFVEGGTKEIGAVANVAIKVSALKSFDDNYTYNMFIDLKAGERIKFDWEHRPTGGGGWTFLDLMDTFLPNWWPDDLIINFTAIFNIPNAIADHEFRINIDGVTTGTIAFQTLTYTDEASGTPPGIVPNYPSAVVNFQQRLVFGGFTYNRQQLTLSRTGDFLNFDRTAPSREDDSFDLTVDSATLNEVRDLVAHGALLIFTSGAEYRAEGSGRGPLSLAGTLTPTSFDIAPMTAFGSSWVSALVVGGSVLFLADRDRSVREWQVQQGDAVPRELTIVANHLLQNHGIVEWAYAAVPDQVVYAIRSDGTMLGLTFVPEHNVWGWHRHDTEGTFESIATIPEGSESKVYVVVNRTISGSTKRYIERFATTRWSGVEDSIFLDSALAYTGTNTYLDGSVEPLHEYSLLNGTTWDAGSLMTINGPFSPDKFVSGDVGSRFNIRFTDAGVVTTYRLEITRFIGVSMLEARLLEGTVAAAHRHPTDTDDWGFARATFSGLSHLEGKTVKALLDGNVQDGVAVSGGAVTFQNFGEKAVVGMAFTAEIESLNLTSKRKPDRMSRKSTPEFAMEVDNWRGLYAGADLNNLREVQQRDVTDNYGTIQPQEGLVRVRAPQGNERTRFMAVRQVDPLPAKILSFLVEFESE